MIRNKKETRHLRRIYFAGKLEEKLSLTLEGEHFHYLKNVLRCKVNDDFRIFNGQDGEFRAYITATGKKSLTIQIDAELRKNETILDMTLALCITGSEQLTEAIKQAVELGVTAIIPIISARSQYNKINTARVRKNIIEATEQSERLNPPLLKEVISLRDFCQINNYEQIIFVDEQEQATSKINNIKFFSKNIVVLIGAEGGFTDAERQLLKALPNVKSISLGQNILRTRTAVVAAIACITMIRN